MSKVLPLKGVRVLDLGQFIAIPFCSQWLAWLGAEVLVVESRRHMTSRSAPPFAAGLAGNFDASGYFNLLYGAKKSCAIDLTKPEGRSLVERLVSHCDVMVDNFSTGVLEKLGLGYDVVRRARPDIIMLSCSAFGRTGPMKDAKGFHSAVNLFCGLADVTGYVGGHPRITGGCLPDPLGGTAAVFAILAALHSRRRTGQGQRIDLAMYEVMMSLIPDAIIDYTGRGVEPVRRGNGHADIAPHGIYRCAGDDEWVAISVVDEAAWHHFCAAIEHPDWKKDTRFADASARRQNEAALNSAIEEWTQRRSAAEVTRLLQNVKVAAGPVLRADQLLNDSQLVERGTVIENDHPIGGRHRQIGLPWVTDGFAHDYARAPLLGEHTRDILGGLLGIGDEEYAKLQAQGVLA